MTQAVADQPAATVIGIGEAGPTPLDDRAIPEIVLQAVEAALGDAGIGFDDIDAAVTASVDLNDGLTASNIAVTEVVGAVMGPETRISGDGLGALAHAACLIWSGAYRTVLVVAHGKASMADQDAISQWALDPVAQQRLGASFAVHSGLQARVLMDSDKASDPSEVERRWAQRAADLRGITADEVLASPLLASPLRELMAAPPADGAIAVVLRSGAASTRDHEGPRLLITGVGFDLDAHEPGDRNLRAWEGLTRALERAAAMEASDKREFDHVEASFRFPHEEGLFAAATGLAPTGDLFAGDVPVAAGLGRFVAAARKLRARPGRALAHGTWGPAGQAHAVAILERPAPEGIPA